MPTTRYTTTRRVGRKPPAPAIPEVTKAEPKARTGVMASRAAQAAARPAIDPDTQRAMIAEAAYYCAEKRGFAQGGELEDWLAAEAQIRARLET